MLLLYFLTVRGLPAFTKLKLIRQYRSPHYCRNTERSRLGVFRYLYYNAKDELSWTEL